jgi:hypothetical protein
VFSGQVVVVENPDVEDGVVSAEAKVENGAKTDCLHGEVVLVGGGQRHLNKSNIDI